jgi:FtsZ-binding cell division protein ZapB
MLDQKDIIAQLEKCQADLKAANETVKNMDALRLQLSEATTKATDLTSKVTDLTGKVAALEKERDTLKTENTGLQASQADFDKKMVAELSKRGISSSASEASKPSDKKLTATELCLAAKNLPLDTKISVV